MSVTVAQLISDVEKILGEVDGSGVQTYGEDRLLNEIRRGFNLIFKKFPWPQYTQWWRLALDGVSGVVSLDDQFANVMAFEDFFAVFRDAESTPLPTMARRTNPYTITGNQVRFWDSLPVTDTLYTAKRLKFWPEVSTGYVNIGARIYPTEDGNWDADGVMDFDRDMLGFAAAFMALSNDDINPGAAETNRVLMEMKYKDIIKGLASTPISISGNSGVPSTWFVNP